MRKIGQNDRRLGQNSSLEQPPRPNRAAADQLVDCSARRCSVAWVAPPVGVEKLRIYFCGSSQGPQAKCHGAGADQ